MTAANLPSSPLSESMQRYGTLDAEEINRTIERLSLRIGERFPDSGLRLVCLRLLEVSREASRRSEEIGRPIRWLRVATACLATFVVVGSVASVVLLARSLAQSGEVEWLQTFEAGINDIIFVGLAVAFLVTLEGRIKRRRALAALHELRSIAHIIDMHQLTKDPERILFRHRRTSVLPPLEMTPFELDRYLDYSSEMLSLIGKIAALYVRHFEDPQAVAAVNDIEDLTSGLARKIWQKIMILHQMWGPQLADAVASAGRPLLLVPRESASSEALSG